MPLHLYNTLTRKKEAFTPQDEKDVRMYVCGPTVYDRPHIGNARSVVVYDVLYRLLTHLYGKEHVTYVRNITDVDDKINAAAKQNNEPISALTGRVEGWFHDDMKALGVLGASATLNGKKPSNPKGYMGEPHATHHIPHMVSIIEKLIANGNAYVSQGHVLFAVDSYKEYGALSGRKLDELVAGARIEVEGYKKHPGDFVLWKPAEAGDDPSSVFESPWGAGRPGWHIECSAMSSTYLGDNFDIHGGGADLMFPHHENEIAQSRCSATGSSFAKYWVHNGFLTVNGEKMSKSLGNFITVHDLLSKGVKGEVIRLALLMTKYNEPLDWSEKLLHDAKKTLDYFYRALSGYNPAQDAEYSDSAFLKHPTPPGTSYLTPLLDDLNVPAFFSILIAEANLSNSLHPNARMQYQRCLYSLGKLLGFFTVSAEEWFKGGASEGDDKIQSLIDARAAAKKAKNWPEADRIRKELADSGIILEDRPDGTTDWRRA